MPPVVLCFATGCGSFGIDFAGAVSSEESLDQEVIGADGVGGAATKVGERGGIGGSNSGGAADLGSGGNVAVGGRPAVVGNGGAIEESGSGGEFLTQSGGASVGGTGGQPGYRGCLHDCADAPVDPLFYHESINGVPQGLYETGTTRIEVDRDFSRGSGGQALRLSAEGLDSEVEIGSNFALLDEGPLVVRIWLHVPEGPMSDWVKIVGINPAQGTVTGDGPNSGIHVRIDPMGRVLVIHSEGDTEWTSEVDAYPRGEWFCLQIYLVIDDEKGEIDVRIDGESVLYLEEVDTSPEVGVARVVYGIAAIGPGSAANLIYFDDIYAAVPCGDELTDN